MKFSDKCERRLYSSDGHALIDLMMRPGEDPPEVGKRVLCRHPFEESKRAYVMPHKVEPLYKVSLTDSPHPHHNLQQVSEFQSLLQQIGDWVKSESQEMSLWLSISVFLLRYSVLLKYFYNSTEIFL